MQRDPNRFWNPYLAGVALGLVLLSGLVVLGKGLGASGASFRAGVAVVQAVAPAHVAASPGLRGVAETGHPLDDWLVFQMLGVLLGGVVAAYTSGRLSMEVLKGPRISTAGRIAMALAGGLLMGIGAKLSRGCASGQALTGGGLMSAGSWAFMMTFFGGGYSIAYFVRRAWR
ncbi:MAG TPA: YeeE/YedE thiosulfate transporter family protein [Anaeromyxobacter sp.]|nr:YeeE/YedE thiosulfate transporter family protein [Anaeromyxobacter sp.]